MHLERCQMCRAVMYCTSTVLAQYGTGTRFMLSAQGWSVFYLSGKCKSSERKEGSEETRANLSERCNPIAQCFFFFPFRLLLQFPPPFHIPGFPIPLVERNNGGTWGTCQRGKKVGFIRLVHSGVQYTYSTAQYMKCYSGLFICPSLPPSPTIDSRIVLPYLYRSIIVTFTLSFSTYRIYLSLPG